MIGARRIVEMKWRNAAAFLLAGVIIWNSAGEVARAQTESGNGFGDFVTERSVAYTDGKGGVHPLEEGALLTADTPFTVEYAFELPPGTEAEPGKSYEVELPALLLAEGPAEIPVTAQSAWGETAEIGLLELTAGGKARVRFDHGLEMPGLDSGVEEADSGMTEEAIPEEEETPSGEAPEDGVLYLDEEPMVTHLINPPEDTAEEPAVLDSGLENSPAWNGRIQVPCMWDMEALEEAIASGNVRLNGVMVMVAPPLLPMDMLPRAGEFNMMTAVSGVRLYEDKGPDTDFEHTLAAGAKLSFENNPILVYYDFKISADEITAIQAGGSSKQYNVDLPKGLKLVSGGGAKDIPLDALLADGSKVQFGTLHLPNDNTTIPYVTFIENIQTTNGGVFRGGISSGYLEMTCQLDKEQVGAAKTFDIEVPNKFKLNITAIDNADKLATLTKIGEFKNGRILWTVTVTPPGPNKNLLFKDTLDANQIFVENSFLVDGAAPATAPTVSGQVITWPLTVEDQKGKISLIITYETALTDDAFHLSNPGVALTDTQAKNEACLMDGTAVVKDTLKSVTVTAKGEQKAFVRKVGEYDKENKLVKWTVNIQCQDRKLQNLVLHDEMDANLKFVRGSVTGIGLGDTVSTTANGFEIAFENSSLKTSYKIEYSTEVDESVYEETGGKLSMNNKAWLTFNWRSYTGPGPGYPETYTPPGLNAPVEVERNLIAKEPITYNRAKEELSWKITVNPYKIGLDNGCTVTDTLGADQNYVRIEDVTPAGAVTEDSKASDKVVFKVGNQGSTPVTFTVVTKVTNKAHSAANQSGVMYQNHASIAANLSGSPKTATVTAEQKVVSEVLAKAGAAYDPKTQMIQWEITVNQNKMKLNNVVVDDPLPAGLTLVEDAAHQPVDENKAAVSYTPSPLQFKLVNLTDTKKILFYTKVDVDSFSDFQGNGKVEIQNSATLKSDDILSSGVTASGKQEIQNSLMNKGSKLRSDCTRIDYVLNLNGNRADLTGTGYDKGDSTALKLQIKDQLSDGLRLDLDSIRLYQVADGDFKEAGNASPGTPVDASKVDVVYDAGQRLMTVTLTVVKNQAYQLCYSAGVIKNKKITNKAALLGSSDSDNATSGNDVSLGGGGGGAVSNKGSVTITKVDALRPDVKLQNVGFKLYRVASGGTEYQEDYGVTGADGTLKFEGLDIGLSYRLEEDSGTTPSISGAPSGYPISYSDGNYYTGTFTGTESPASTTVSYPFKAGELAKDLKVVRTNEPKTVSSGQISFLKINQYGEELTGAKFKLVDQTKGSKYNPPAATAPTINGAKTTFDLMGFPFGVYKLEEVTPPANHTKPGSDITITIDQNGDIGPITGNADVVGSKTVDGNPMTTITNQENVGGLTITKKDALRPDVAVQDVKFKIVGWDGAEQGVGTSWFPASYTVERTTDAKGEVVFDKLRPGKTYRITESSTEAELNALGYTPAGTYWKPGAAAAETETGYYEFTVPTGSDKSVAVTRKNMPVCGTVEFVKTTQFGNRLSGAEFQLTEQNTGSRAPFKATAASGADGMVTFTGVPFGAYLLAETKAPAGYKKAENSLVSVEKNGTTGKIAKQSGGALWPNDTTNAAYQAIQDEELTGSITLTIVDELRPERILSGRTVKLEKLNADGTPDGAAVTLLTDSSGKVKFDSLQIGREYRLTQTDTKDRYHNRGIYAVGDDPTKPSVSTEPSCVVTVGNAQNDDNTDASSDRILIRTNVPYVGAVTFQKENPWERPLQGAVFTLTEKDSPVGATAYTAEKTSDIAGKLLFEKVPEGVYTVVEKTAPAGYSKDTAVYTAEIVADQTTVNLKNSGGASVTKVVNEFAPSQQGSIVVTKTDSADSSLKLAGAKFVLRDSKGNVRGPESATGSDGKLTFPNLMLGETYTLEETAAPQGYQMPEGAAAARSVVVTDATAPLGWNVEVTWKNARNTGDIQFTKASAMDGTFEEAVPGAVFGLYPKTGAMTEATQIQKAASGADGAVLFRDVPVGQYRIHEDETPAAFEKPASDEVFSITIDADGNPSALLDKNGIPVPDSKVYNKAKTGSLTIEKTGAVANRPSESVILPEVKFALYLGDVKKAEGVTDSSGKLTFTGLLYDKDYTVKELEAPERYALEEKTVKITAIDPTPSLGWRNELRRGPIRFRNVSTQQRPLAGVRFAIYAGDDTELQYPLMSVFSDEFGVVLFADMPVGTYLIRQEETPSGHLPNQKVFKAEMTEQGTCPGLSDADSDDPPTDQVVNATPPAVSGGGGGGGSGGGPTVSKPGQKAGRSGFAPGYGYRYAVGSSSPNPAGKNQIILMKKTPEGVAVAGAVFAVFDENGQLVAEATTNENGEAFFYGLDLGANYIVKEVEPAPGYEPDNTSHGFDAGEQEIIYESMAHRVGAAGSKRPPATGRGIGYR